MIRELVLSKGGYVGEWGDKKLRKVDGTELREIMDAHKLWLEGKGGKRADLNHSDLSDVCLKGVDLKGADLSHADLSDADLKGADLRCADLSCADLRNANLSYASLKGADLSGANLRRANLSGTDLSGANLRRANLSGVDLDFSSWPLWCGGLRVKTDRRLMAQLAYHFCCQDCDDPDYIKARDAILWFANSFHRVGECGKLEPLGKDRA